jgi:hypothetical protein
VDLDEGLSGGGWQMTVVPASECRAESADERQQQKQHEAERKRQEKSERHDQKVEGVLRVHGRTWLTAAMIRGLADMSGDSTKDALTRLLAAGKICERQSPKRSDWKEYLLPENVEAVARDEAERDAVDKKSQDATHTQEISHSMDWQSSPAGADVAAASSGQSGQTEIVQSSPDSPVDGGKRKNSRRKPSGTTSTKRQRKEAVILDVSGSLVEPSAVDAVPEVVADVSVCDGIPF